MSLLDDIKKEIYLDDNAREKLMRGDVVSKSLDTIQKNLTDLLKYWLKHSRIRNYYYVNGFIKPKKIERKNIIIYFHLSFCNTEDINDTHTNIYCDSAENTHIHITCYNHSSNEKKELTKNLISYLKANNFLYCTLTFDDTKIFREWITTIYDVFPPLEYTPRPLNESNNLRVFKFCYDKFNVDIPTILFL